MNQKLTKDEIETIRQSLGKVKNSESYDRDHVIVWICGHQEKLLSHIETLEEENGQLLEAVKNAYRKHHLGDESIGWDELDDLLKDTLCEVLSDKGFQEFLDHESLEKL